MDPMWIDNNKLPLNFDKLLVEILSNIVEIA
jgi:hypothetical protein